jgi:hypothetical protein
MWAFIGMGLLAIPGVIKLTEETFEMFMVGRGYIKTFLILPNRRISSWYTKPKMKEIIVGDQAYEFSDDPDYMPTLTSTVSSMPMVMLDSKTNKQLKICNTFTSLKDVNPVAQRGAGKLAWTAGFLEGAGDIKQLKLFFIVILIAVIGLALMQIMAMNGGKLW